MSDKSNFHLTGGVFFFLLKTFSAKTVNHRERIKGEKEKVSDLKIMSGLIKIFSGTDFGCSSKDVSMYMNCRTNGSAGVPLNDELQINDFIKRIKSQYDDVTKDMTTFISNYINLHMKENLVSALICIIENDDDIPEEQEFFINRGGSSMTKANIRNESIFCLSSFLIGVFRYIEENRFMENEKGRDTLELISEKKFSNKPRTYSVKKIKDKIREVNVFFEEIPTEEINKKEGVVKTENKNNSIDFFENERNSNDSDYNIRRANFLKELNNLLNEETSDMDIFYKSSILGKKYIDIMDYIQKNKMRLVDLNSNPTDKFENDTVYKYNCPCHFNRETDNFYSWVKVTIELNGTEISAETSENKWLNRSIVSNYNNKSRNCTCYFIYDQEKVFLFLQISEQ